jgi:hypothetical protein
MFALGAVELAEVVEARCDLRVLRSISLFPDLERPLMEGPRLPVARLGEIDEREVVEHIGDLGVFGPSRRAAPNGPGYTVAARYVTSTWPSSHASSPCPWCGRTGPHDVVCRAHPGRGS